MAERTRSSVLVIVCGVVIAAVCLAVALSRADLGQLMRRLENTRPVWAAAILTISMLFYGLRAWRWQLLLRGAPYAPLFHANMIGYLGNSFLPARAGDAMRLLWGARATGIHPSRILGSIVVERMLDVIALAFVISLGSLLPGGGALIHSAWIVGMAMLAVLLLMIRRSHWLLGLLARIGMREKLQNWAQQFLDVGAAQRGRLLPVAALTLLIWVCDAAVLTCAGIATGTLLSPQAALLLSASLGLSTVIPSTPGYVGVYQMVAVSILALFHIAADAALALVLLYQALAYVLITALGGIGLVALVKTGNSKHTG